jgi:hypothetical protein
MGDLLESNAVQLKDLEDILGCPVCLSVPRTGTPVYKCYNGHIICGTCAEQIPEEAAQGGRKEGIPGRKCPTCRVIFSVNRRNRIAEKIIGKCDFEVPCTHTGRGCTNADEKSMIKEHEANCGSRPVKCLYEDCGENINLDQLFNHSKQNHESKPSPVHLIGNVIKEYFFLSSDRITGFLFVLERITGILFVLEGQSYIPILWKDDNTFHSMLYILASKEVAEKYKVTISISGKDVSVVYTTNVVSIDTPISEAKNNKENSLPLNNFLAKKCISNEFGIDGIGRLTFEYKVLKFQAS